MNDLTRHMVSKNQKVWNTGVEQAFNQYQLSRRLGLMQNVSLPFQAPDRQDIVRTFDFQLDFARPRDFGSYMVTGFHEPGLGFDTDFEIDGKGHKDKNDHWKDAIKNSAGLMVVHVPGVMTAKKFWPSLDVSLRGLVFSPTTLYVDEYA